MAKLLTVKSVAAARPGIRRREIPDAALPGLHLIVQPSGAKSWALRYRVAGRSRKATIGPATLIDLVAARAAARRMHAAIAAGEDPALLKRRSRETTAVETFATVARRFIERYAKPTNRSWKESERMLALDVLPRWGDRPLASITRADVVALLDAIVDRGSPIIANRVLSVIRRLFDWAIERGTLEGSPTDRVRAPAPEVIRDRVHTDAELALIWQAAGTIAYPFGPYLRMLILSGQRRDEVAALTWHEIDLPGGLWTLPAERAKNGVQHHVPLSSAVGAILAGLPHLGDFVFTSTGRVPIGGFSHAKTILDSKVTQLNGDVPLTPWRFHDFRRDMASGMARLGVQLPVIEKVLNHVGGSFGGIVSVYQRHSYAEEKRQALEAWARHVVSL